MKKVSISRILNADPYLEPFRDALQARAESLERRRDKLLGDMTVSEFANGYLYYGLSREEDAWVAREWAPAADAVHLIGDFNGWNRVSHPMTRIGNGDWELRLPADAIAEGSRVLLQIRNGSRVFDRVPAYARQVEQDKETNLFTAVAHVSRYEWQNEVKPKTAPDPLLIYEAHVGMAQEKEGIGTYREFTENVLPRIKRAGYNAVQLMAIQEHPYYASFGYQATSLFAPAHWFGAPDDLKALIDAAHGMGLRVLLDVVHAHACDNARDGLSDFDGSGGQYCEGRHPAWGTYLYNYNKHEVLHFLLSNLKYWLCEYRFDGFRFDGVTSMLYTDHGLGRAFTRYDDYFDVKLDESALSYLALAAELTREVNPEAITVCEDMSGLPALCLPRAWGGIGMKYRLNMGIPDYWIKLVKDTRDEDWNLGALWYELTRRRPMEKTVGYCESHDQALVGDKTLLFRMMDAEMYTGMDRAYHSENADRAIALIKMIKLLTAAAAGDGYLNFMGNEFGHPEWIDFPREGNGWSYRYARRQWSLEDDGYLKYGCLAAFDRDMLAMLKKYKLPRKNARNLWIDETNKLLVYEKGGLIFAFNFHPWKTCADFPVPGVSDGQYLNLLDTGDDLYAGAGRAPETLVARDGALALTLPPRAAAAYGKA